uniref:CHAP domain-containing protein n=1 Tax=Nitrospira cf. moscoviensis SBR1015 TaxID=96242 RepID=UPI00117CF9EA|nr:CHAP domain-containing protein [Nitrospira cf. moscoviensis SBR1015]
MLPPKPEAVARLLAVARAMLFVQEQPHGSNAGQAVEAFQRVTGNRPPDPWCASFIAYCGRAAFGQDWPVPMTASCQALHDWAMRENRITTMPDSGDLYLLYYPSLTRMAHIAIIEHVRPDGSLQTIEGNTNDGGSRDGFGVFRRTRKPKPTDAFVRWIDP